MYIHQLAGNRADAMVPGPVPRLAPPRPAALPCIQQTCKVQPPRKTTTIHNVCCLPFMLIAPLLMPASGQQQPALCGSSG